MRPSLEEVVKQSEVVVIGNGSTAFCGVRDLMREDQTLIDLVGITRNSHNAPKAPAVLQGVNNYERVYQ
jgi:hypothetical protein